MSRPHIDPKKKVEMLREAVKPVVCETLEDIRRVLKPFLDDSPAKQVQFKVDVKWSDQEGTGVDKGITGVSNDATLSLVLIEGMEAVKRRMEATEKIKTALKVAEDNDELGDDIPIQNWAISNVDDLCFKVDSLIKKKLGGKRRGLRIRWKVLEGSFEFDPYSKKLFQVDDDK